jgi:hypothetical protein
VYLKQSNLWRRPTEVVSFFCEGPVPRPYVLDNSANAGGTINLKMEWATPSHLEVTYSGQADLYFQVFRYSGIEISVRDVSGKTASASQSDEGLPTASSQSVILKDRTDWWSINNSSVRQPDVKARNATIAPGTFEIAGVDLGRDQFRKLAIKMGKATVVERGDASTGRQQVCYTADDDAKKIYLIFEYGADESVFYLFSDGANWKGQKLCVSTKQVSLTLGTASGLKLGLNRVEVEAILGRADAVFNDKLVYTREIQVKTTPAEFEKVRNEYPQHLTDRLAHEKFDFYHIEIYIEARFGNSGMNYLAVSKSAGIE